MTRSRADANVRSLRPAGHGPMLAMAAMVALAALVGAQGPPTTDKRAVVDTYHGTQVSDEPTGEVVPGVHYGTAGGSLASRPSQTRWCLARSERTACTCCRGMRRPAARFSAWH
jgi:hypothetical protein